MDPINSKQQQQDTDSVKVIKIEEAKKRAINAGRFVASPVTGDEIVITGKIYVFVVESFFFL